MTNKIPESKKPFLGLRIGDGTNNALIKACKGMGISRSEFTRYCIIRTLQDLSLISQQVNNDVIKNRD